MHTNTKILLLVLFVLVVCLSSHQVHAFGAGNIPSFAYMEGRAFRHGDIEDVLEEIKKTGGFALGSIIGKGKFSGLDIKRVYFGNWLRDYSQAVDIAGLKKLQLQSIINLCMVLGFMAHGYATAEFEVTPERLGVYLPVEHIDNPKGYGDGEDARKYHPKLRPPVNPQELEVDPRSGMKNYIANENGHWDTSKAHVRRLLHQCIDTGRRARSGGNKDAEYESLRLLGTLLHTLEDFPAHSNFCELALVNMGHRDVFVHVGDAVRIHAPNGRSVAPLVTGTFGGSDFIHSLLGEAGDHLSQASVSDLNKELEKAKMRSRGGPGGSPNPADVLRDLLFKFSDGSGNDMARDVDGIERLRAGPSQGGKNPEEMSPQELHAALWQILSFRDSVVKKISATIDKIPGLGPLIEKLMDSISVFIFTTLEPYLKPILKTATGGLMSASGEVIDTHDQYEVFNDPRASDPTHSFLSKDHFNLILNEPAGKIAKVIVMNTVHLVVKAWDDNSVNINQLAEEVLQCLFHPDFHDSGSKVQREMMQCLHEWAKGLGGKEHEIIRRLNKQCVRNHENVRMAGEGGVPEAQGTQAYTAGLQAQQDIQGYLNNIPGVAQAQNLFGQFGGPPNQGARRDLPGPTTQYGQSPLEPPNSAGHSSSFFGDSAPGPGHSGSSYPGGPSGGSSYPGGPPGGSSYPGGPPGGSSYPGGGSSYPGGGPSYPGGGSSYPGGPSSYAPPPGPPVSPPAPGGYGGSYAPSYAPSYGSPPPSFPGGPPHMPSASGGFPGAAHGFPPAGPPPGGFASPFGGPPGFPDADAPPPHGHGHHHGGHNGPPPGGFGGGW